MNTYYIYREDEVYGPYTTDQLKNFLSDGTVARNDYIFQEGWEESAPLEAVFKDWFADQDDTQAPFKVDATKPREDGNTRYITQDQKSYILMHNLASHSYIRRLTYEAAEAMISKHKKMQLIKLGIKSVVALIIIGVTAFFGLKIYNDEAYRESILAHFKSDEPTEETTTVPEQIVVEAAPAPPPTKPKEVEPVIEEVEETPVATFKVRLQLGEWDKLDVQSRSLLMLSQYPRELMEVVNTQNEIISRKIQTLISLEEGNWNRPDFTIEAYKNSFPAVIQRNWQTTQFGRRTTEEVFSDLEMIGTYQNSVKESTIEDLEERLNVFERTADKQIDIFTKQLKKLKNQRTKINMEHELTLEWLESRFKPYIEQGRILIKNNSKEKQQLEEEDYFTYQHPELVTKISSLTVKEFALEEELTEVPDEGYEMLVRLDLPDYSIYIHPDSENHPIILRKSH